MFKIVIYVDIVNLKRSAVLEAKITRHNDDVESFDEIFLQKYKGEH